MRTHAVVLSILMGAALTSGAETPAIVMQPAPMSTIESTGVATVEAAPDYVVFWFHRDASGTTFVEAIRTALELGPALRKELTNRQVGGYELNLSGPAIVDLGKTNARVSAWLRFSMNTFSNHETGPALFGALCDQMAQLGQSLACAVEGPSLIVDNPSAVEQSATTLAVENALPLAQAAATLMNAQIVAVDRLAIEPCSWNTDPETKATLPDMRRLTCTSHVRVTYSFVTPQP